MTGSLETFNKTTELFHPKDSILASTTIPEKNNEEVEVTEASFDIEFMERNTCYHYLQNFGDFIKKFIELHQNCQSSFKQEHFNSLLSHLKYYFKLELIQDKDGVEVLFGKYDTVVEPGFDGPKEVKLDGRLPEFVRNLQEEINNIVSNLFLHGVSLHTFNSLEFVGNALYYLFRVVEHGFDDEVWKEILRCVFE